MPFLKLRQVTEDNVKDLTCTGTKEANIAAALSEEQEVFQTAQLSLGTRVPSLEPKPGGWTLQSGPLTACRGTGIPPLHIDKNKLNFSK